MNVDLTFKARHRGSASALTERLMDQGLNVDRSPKSDGSFAVYATGQISSEDFGEFAAEMVEGLDAEYVG